MLHCVLLSSEKMIRLLALGLQVSEILNTTSIKLYFTSVAIITSCISLDQQVAYEGGAGENIDSSCLPAHIPEGAGI